MSLDLEGVYVPVVTPFDGNGDLDLTTLTVLIERGLDAGVQGIVSCGTMGEYYALSEAERIYVMRHTVLGRPGPATLPGATWVPPGWRSCSPASLATSATTRSYWPRRRRRCRAAARLAADLVPSPKPASCRRSSTTIRRVPASRSVSTASTRSPTIPHRRHQGIERRLLQVPALQRRYSGPPRHHVRHGRPGGGLLLWGVRSGWPAPRTCCPGIMLTPEHGQRRQPREAPASSSADPAVDPEHGGRFVQRQGQARPAPPGDRLLARSVSRCCRLTRPPTRLHARPGPRHRTPS